MPPEDDQKQLVPVTGRTLFDLIHESESRPVLDTIVKRMGGFVLWAIDAPGVAARRVIEVLRSAERKVTAKGAEVRAIPERVGMPVLQAVAVEDRSEIRELWASLLASAATGEEVDDYAIGIVKQLSPDAAWLLYAIGNRPIPRGEYPDDWCLITLDGSEGNPMLKDVAFPPDAPEVVPERRRLRLAVSRLQALGLVTIDRRTRGNFMEKRYSVLAFTPVGEFIFGLVGEASSGDLSRPPP